MGNIGTKISNVIKSVVLVIEQTLTYFLSIIKFGLICTLAITLWYVIISFIDGEWDIRSWYLYTRGWGRFVMVCIFVLTCFYIAEEYK